MRRSSLLCLLVLVASCQGGGGIGDRCTDSNDCGSSLQCVASTCVPHCQRAPECGDGYSCGKDGLCHLATGQPGDPCTSQTDCVTGLACKLDDSAVAGQGHLFASCDIATPGRPAGDVCTADRDCRNGTCALGHCIDLCSDTLDCVIGASCTSIPRVDAGDLNFEGMFEGCLQSHGTLAWPLPIDSPSKTLLLPIPDSAREVAVTFAVDAPDQEVGVLSLISPDARHDTLIVDPTANPMNYYTNLVRHQPELGQSVLVMPSSPSTPLVAGAYSMTVSSLRPTADGIGTGTAVPRATAIIKVDSSVLLDLHFYFLNFDDHPCGASFGNQLDAGSAQTAAFFQNDFLGMMRMVFAHGGVTIGSLTYDDLLDHPDLDGLDVADAPALLALGTHATGVNIYFVRTLSPVGLQAFGPNPGPAGIAGTGQSGVIVGLDTLCYRSWSQVARVTAHEVARYMGLYENVDLDGHVDPIGDDVSSPSENLMFYSELGGTDLSAGQRDVLTRSAVLR